jgi:hypothetical protein
MNQLVALSRAIKAAKERTGRVIAVPVSQGMGNIVDWTGIEMNGSNSPIHIIGPLPISALVTALGQV